MKIVAVLLAIVLLAVWWEWSYTPTVGDAQHREAQKNRDRQRSQRDLDEIKQGFAEIGDDFRHLRSGYPAVSPTPSNNHN